MNQLLLLQDGSVPFGAVDWCTWCLVMLGQRLLLWATIWRMAVWAWLMLVARWRWTTTCTVIVMLNYSIIVGWWKIVCPHIVRVWQWAHRPQLSVRVWATDARRRWVMEDFRGVFYYFLLFVYFRGFSHHFWILVYTRVAILCVLLLLRISMIIITGIVTLMLMLIILQIWRLVYPTLNMSHTSCASVMWALGMQVHISLLLVSHFTACWAYHTLTLLNLFFWT